ncbi:hypothetical protein PT136_04755 (plasmid) [Borreliella garinii]|nr:hypothetical protein PT136_04755 [Borreliella garinii]
MIIRDTFLRNTLALDLLKESDTGLRTLDLSNYMENTKDKQGAA